MMLYIRLLPKISGRIAGGSISFTKGPMLLILDGMVWMPSLGLIAIFLVTSLPTTSTSLGMVLLYESSSCARSAAGISLLTNATESSAINRTGIFARPRLTSSIARAPMLPSFELANSAELLGKSAPAALITSARLASPGNILYFLSGAACLVYAASNSFPIKLSTSNTSSMSSPALRVILLP